MSVSAPEIGLSEGVRDLEKVPLDQLDPSAKRGQCRRVRVQPELIPSWGESSSKANLIKASAEDTSLSLAMTASIVSPASASRTLKVRVRISRGQR